MRLTRNKRLNEMLEDLLANGWRVVRKRKHLVLANKQGRQLYMPLTTSDKGNSADNYMMLVKRARRWT